MKKSVSRVLSCLVVACLVGVGLCKLSALVVNEYRKHIYFYRGKQNIDVLFLGTSHSQDGIYPMELWREYGIISYNLSTPGRMPIFYWQLVNALDYCSPSIVVLDCFGLTDDNYTAFKYRCHSVLDPVPMSLNKIRAACDLADSLHEKAELIFPFTVFHNRWKELDRKDFYVPVRSVQSGAYSNFNVATPRRVPRIQKTHKYKGTAKGIVYLEKIIELCKRNNIKLFLTYLPFPAEEKDLLESHRIFDIAEKHGLHYACWEELRELVDFDTDCQDSVNHLNGSGSRKVTRYIGQRLRHLYGVPDRRNDPKYAEWNGYYRDYMQFKIDLIKAQKPLKNALMLLSDRNFSFAVYFPSPSLYQNRLAMKLLRNAGASVEQIFFQSPNLIVVDNKAKNSSYRKVGENAASSFGALCVRDVKDGRSFTLGEKELLKLKNDEPLTAAVIVFDNETGKCVVTNKYTLF